MKTITNILRWLALPGWRCKVYHDIQLTQSPQTQAGQAELLQQLPRRGAARIFLPKQTVLTKKLTLPRKARAQSPNIMMFRKENLEAETQSALVDSFARFGREGDSDVYLHYLAKSLDIDAIRHACSSQCVEMANVSTVHDGKVVALLQIDTRVQRAQARWWMAAAAAVLFGLSWLLWSEFNHTRDLQKQLDTLRAENSRFQAEIDSFADNQTRQRNKAQQLSETVEELKRQQSMTFNLASLSSTIPESAWLTEFIWTSDRIKLRGSSAVEPIMIIETLEAEPWITSVSLAQPVRTDRRTNRHTFDLDLRVSQGEVP